MNNILEIKNLSKSYENHCVLNSLNMTVPLGAVYGFVGKNGSGKTTTMKLILGLLKADCGTIEVCNKKVKFGLQTSNKLIGYLPDVPAFYSYMNAIEYLKLCGEITSIPKECLLKRIDEVLDLVGLCHKEKRIQGYSRGMKQRLGFAQALLNKPKLLICDEPTSALDPMGRKEILDIIYKIKNQTTVIFSTHILSDVQSICDYVGILNDGHLILEGKLDEIKRSYSDKSVEIIFSNEKDKTKFIKSILMKQDFIKDSRDNLKIKMNIGNDLNRVKQLFLSLAELSIVPIGFQVFENSLEDIFMKVVGE